MIWGYPYLRKPPHHPRLQEMLTPIHFWVSKMLRWLRLPVPQPAPAPSRCGTGLVASSPEKLVESSPSKMGDKHVEFTNQVWWLNGDIPKKSRAPWWGQSVNKCRSLSGLGQQMCSESWVFCYAGIDFTKCIICWTDILEDNQCLWGPVLIRKGWLWKTILRLNMAWNGHKGISDSMPGVDRNDPFLSRMSE